MLVIYCLLIGVEPKDHRRVHHLRCSPRGGFERIADVASKSRRRFERRYISRSRKPRDVSLRNLPAAPYFSTRRYRDVSHGSLDIGPPPLSRMYSLLLDLPVFSAFPSIRYLKSSTLRQNGRCPLRSPFSFFFSSRFLLFLLRSFANSGTDVHDCSSPKSNEGRYSEEDRREKMVGFRNGSFYEP